MYLGEKWYIVQCYYTIYFILTDVVLVINWKQWMMCILLR